MRRVARVDRLTPTCTSDAMTSSRAITSSHVRHLEFRDFNTRPGMQLVLRNFACASLHIHVAGSRRRGARRCPPANAVRADLQARCVRPGRLAFATGGAFCSCQRNDLLFIFKALIACESRIRKFQESSFVETFSVAAEPMSLNLRGPISIYPGSKAYVGFATIPLFYGHIRVISVPRPPPRMTNRAAMPKG
jgi:hypothetical protein